MRDSARVVVSLLAGLVAFPMIASGEAVVVELKQTQQGWQLLRGGQPYLIKGAGGNASLEQLAAAGGNSVRTWDSADIDALLDEAHALGISVTVGIWLGHERHGFDYDDKLQVRAQLERARKTVLRYKDHPAVLLWGIGNEMEGFEDGDNPAIWKAVNDVAAMVKDLDPHHPTMSVTAFVHGERIEYLHKRSPAIDIHGVNAYGGAVVVPEQLRAGGATKPFVLTEFGPVGPWEMPKTEWGAPIEQTSAEKAAFYRQSYEQAIEGAPGLALGSYAFLWGDKMEGTATWFGMFLEDGSRTGAVDVMTELWSGSKPSDLAPTAEPLVIVGEPKVDPGMEIRVRSVIADPEGSEIRARWVLQPESDDYATGGDFRPNLPEIDGALLEGDVNGAKVRMPDEPGAYRLFLYAYDEAGNAATANVPLLVKGERRTRLPVPVYEDGFEGMPWA
ncbi:MAG: glycoside hydrolase family 2 TIM barrel-domain containing protein, partial [Woeseiaceae bacterium]